MGRVAQPRQIHHSGGAWDRPKEAHFQADAKAHKDPASPARSTQKRSVDRRSKSGAGPAVWSAAGRHRDSNKGVSTWNCRIIGIGARSVNRTFQEILLKIS